MINDTNTFVLRTFNLPIVRDIHSFADCIGLSYPLLYILSQENNDQYYKDYKIPKKNGLFRIVHEPSYSMKMVQRWILEEILYKIPNPEYSYGFKKGVSKPLVQNAGIHKNNLYILRLDLKNFFPSIERPKIYFLFKQIGYNSTMANLFTNICTLKNRLPQGAVTSPCIANLVCAHLDRRLAAFCNKKEIAYSRYADDLSFSSNDRITLKSIYGVVNRIIEDEGFIINSSKTHFLTPKSKRSITGITITSDGLKAPKEMKRMLRSMIHRAIVSCDYHTSNRIKGYISYISSIEEDYPDKISRYIMGFSKKGTCTFDQVVKSYNLDKFFDKMPNFSQLDLKEMVPLDEIEEYTLYQYEERLKFLKERGLRDKETYK